MMRPMMCVTPPAFPATNAMFSKIVTSALFAGFAAGLIAALLQITFVQPVLLHAELYESGALVHLGPDPVSAIQDTGGIDLRRDGLSVLFTALVYTGYAFMLVAAMALASLRGITVTARQGIIWGLAGFITFHFAPAFSLPPELPGSSAADVTARQIWWFGTVAATGCAMALLGLGRTWVFWIAGIALLLAPHLIGAPEPETFAGTVPPELGGLFASRTLGVGMAAWAALGLTAALVWDRETAPASQPRTA
jgi:cobalt transporter subunit CbtA